MSQIAIGPSGMGSMRLAPVGRGRVGSVPAGVAARRPVAGTRARRRVRWGRIVMLVCAALVATAAAVAATGAVADSAPDRGDGAVVQRVTALQEHVVAPGDTLWSIAVAASPDSDPREMVDRIMRLNGLSAGDIQVGDVVLVPNRR